jgi:hypothetical protein
MLKNIKFLRASQIISSKICFKRFSFDNPLYKKYKKMFEEKHELEKYFPKALKTSEDVTNYLEVSENSNLKFSNQAAIDALNYSIFKPCQDVIHVGESVGEESGEF